VLFGASGEPTIENGARTGNVAFIVGRVGVVVVETGVSYKHGEEIIAAVANVTDRPIKLAIITHPVQEFLFGAAAFQARGIPVLMHRRAAELMASRCEICRRNLIRLLGEDAMAGTRIVKPDRLIERGETLTLTGRKLRLIATAWSSAPGALAVFDETSSTLIAGDMALVERVPDVRDADHKGWLTALDLLKRTRCKHVIPGHGRAGSCAGIDSFAGYLLALDAHVGALLKAGVGLAELSSKNALPQFAAWDNYDVQHAQNAQRVYLRREADLLGTDRAKRALSPTKSNQLSK